MACFQDLPLRKIRRLAGHHKKHSRVCADFSKIGSGGKFLGNLYRDLFKKLKQQGCVQPTMILIPMRNRRGTVRTLRWPVIAPHEFIAHVVESGCWKGMLVGDYDIDLFWNALLQEPWFEQLKLLLDAVSDKLRLPLRFHGDEGRFYNLRCILILSLGGILHHQDPYRSRVLLTVVPSTQYSYGHRMVPIERTLKAKDNANGVRKPKLRKLKINNTLLAISEFLAWSLEWCAKGLWPDEPYAVTLA
jgi:hypothetical protein